MGGEAPQLSVDALREEGLFDLPVNEAAERLGMSAGSLKRACRRLGLPRWPYRVRKSLKAVIARTEEYLEDDHTGKKQAILESLRAQLEDVKGRGSSLDGGTRKYRQQVFKLNHSIAKQAGERCGKLRISRAAAGQLLRETQQAKSPAGAHGDTLPRPPAHCWPGEAEARSAPAAQQQQQQPAPKQEQAKWQWPEMLDLPELDALPSAAAATLLPAALPTAIGCEMARLGKWQPQLQPQPAPQLQARAASLTAAAWRRPSLQPWEDCNLLADSLSGAGVRSLSLPALPALHLAGLAPPPLPLQLGSLPAWRPPTLEPFGGELRPPVSPCGTEGSLQSEAVAFACPQLALQPAALPYGWEGCQASLPSRGSSVCSYPSSGAPGSWEQQQQQLLQPSQPQPQLPQPQLMPQPQVPALSSQASAPAACMRSDSSELLGDLALSLGLL